MCAYCTFSLSTVAFEQGDNFPKGLDCYPEDIFLLPGVFLHPGATTDARAASRFITAKADHPNLPREVTIQLPGPG